MPRKSMAVPAAKSAAATTDTVENKAPVSNVLREKKATYVVVYAPDDAPAEIIDITIRFWKKHAGMQVMEYAGKSIVDTLVSVLADDDKTPFVFVQAGCIPLCRFSPASADMPKIRGESFDTKLPVTIYPDVILPVLASDNITDSTVLDAYIPMLYTGIRPLIVNDRSSMAGYVLRENPDIEALKRAIVERLFLCFNEKGYKAIRPILEKLE